VIYRYGEEVGAQASPHSWTRLYDLDVVVTDSRLPRAARPKTEMCRRSKWTLKDEDRLPDPQFGSANSGVSDERSWLSIDRELNLHRAILHHRSTREEGCP